MIRVDVFLLENRYEKSNRFDVCQHSHYNNNTNTGTMADESKFCYGCNTRFSALRYFKAHLKYEKNLKCKQKWENQPTGAQEPENTLPKKRPHESDDDMDTQNMAESPQVEAHKGSARGLARMMDDTESPSKMSESSLTYTGHEYDEDEYGDMYQVGNDTDDEEDEIEVIEQEQEQQQPEAQEPDTEILQKFKAYTQWAYRNTCPLTKELEAGIQLMALLAEKRCPLNVYDAVYEWHCSNLEATRFINRDSLIGLLSKRYHMEKKGPSVVKDMELPHSKAKIDLVVTDFKEQVQCLLTDPRITDDDYLFHNNNPFEPPPEAFESVGDLNTGEAYRQTYKDLIKDESKEVLLPIVFYMDGAVTGQFDNLPVEALKFTLGIFNAKTRDKVHAWRDLGYVTKFIKEETRGQDIIRDSGHIDAQTYLSDSDNDDNTQANGGNNDNPNDNLQNDGDEEEEVLANNNNNDDDDDDNYMENAALKSCTGQDLHAMLHVILASYRRMQRGFVWDLRYRGQTHHVVFKPFVIFVKGDSVEHDKHCGSYTSRTQGVKQLCRYCCCTTEDTDDPYRRDALKTPEMIQELVDNNDEDGLKDISQQTIQNCWYKIRFASHNKLGIHGACPLEVLHWFQLGKYKYLRGMFMGQTGKDSILTKKMNALVKSMGYLFKRQSDRDKPRTDFSKKGIKKGKLMAHEMTGLILVLIAAIRTTKGRTMLLDESRGQQKQHFGHIRDVKNWIMLLERMLQFEAWLNLPKLSVFEVKRAEVKVRELLAFEKKIGKRADGMKFKTFNFHASVHVPDDILQFGVPNNVNTKSNEMHHKGHKTAALRTQRRAKTFDQQCAKQVHHMTIISLGMEEIMTGDRVWTYFENQSTFTQQEEGQEAEEGEQQLANNQEAEHDNTGTRADFFYDEESDQFLYKIYSRMKQKDRFKLDQQLVEYLGKIMDELGAVVKKLPIFTEHIRHEQMFRGSPIFLGKAWRDWVMIDWGDDLILPGHIACFVDLSEIPPNLAYEPGIYAIIESANLKQVGRNSPEHELSQLFVPYTKQYKRFDANGKIVRRFWIVDVESFHAPTTLYPDIGNRNRAAFLRMEPRSTWARMFSDWLGTPHAREFPKPNNNNPG